MFDFLYNLSPVTQALIATLFTWFMTTLGAGVVFLFKDVKKNVLNIFLGVSAGIMISATFWSLLNPAISFCNEVNFINWVVLSIGIILGTFLIYFGNIFYKKTNKKNSNNRALMLIFSITLHNIPEGLVVGVAFGSLQYSNLHTSLISAFMLALGIGLQNFPEGSAISIPLIRDGYSKKKAFFIGQLSGIVEPIAAIFGVLLAIKIKFLLPFLLSFAAGAMLYVIIQELIPESQSDKNKDIITIFTILGFIFMTILDLMFQ